jgi:hypothetical protein
MQEPPVVAPLLHLFKSCDHVMYRGVLKLCDMGLARFFKPENAAYTPRVVTLW